MDTHVCRGLKLLRLWGVVRLLGVLGGVAGVVRLVRLMGLMRLMRRIGLHDHGVAEKRHIAWRIARYGEEALARKGPSPCRPRFTWRQ